DADLEVQLLGILERLVIVACHCVGEVLVDVGVLGQDGHQRETVIAGWAEGPEPLYVRNCHNFYSLADRGADLWSASWAVCARALVTQASSPQARPGCLFPW